jgi:hypothetical protein
MKKNWQKVRPEYFKDIPETFRADHLTDKQLTEIVCSDYKAEDAIKHHIAEKEFIYRGLHIKLNRKEDER